MSISYDAERKIFNLQTKNSSYVLGVLNDEYLVHIYYGKKLNYVSDISDMLGYNVHRARAFSAKDYGFSNIPPVYSETVPFEYPVYGSDLRTPAFHAKYSDGSTYSRLSYKGYRIIDGKPSLSGLPSVYTENDTEAKTLEIELHDKVKDITVFLSYTVMEDFDAITRNTKIINNSKENVSLQKVMSASIDFGTADFDITHLYGGWAKERQIERKPLMTGLQGIDSKRGSSSHHHNPFIALSEKGATEEFGEVYGFSLVYSGNFEAEAEVDTYDSVRVMLGINSFDFSWLLKPGEDFQTPEAVMVYSPFGFGQMSRCYHRLYRERLCRGKYKNATRPVIINNWEATYFNFDEEKIIAIAKKAKEAGVDMLVLDDGWFGKRDMDNSSLGDWYVYKEKLPCGIDGLAKKVNDEGLDFGLWFEPEMVSQDSDLYRAHPDWCIHIPCRGRSEGRNQLILDLSRAEVCDYIIGAVSDVLKSANIKYVKWDMNRNMSEIGGEGLPAERQRELPHRYMLGLYRVLETITSNFPQVLFEGCSGGGGRFDPAMLYYFPQIWTSDDSDAIERLYIQEGTSLVYPASAISAHVSAVPNHQVGRITHINARGAVAMMGQFGYELDLAKLSDEDFEAVKEQIILYKEIGPIIKNADLYRINSVYKNGYAAWEFVSNDKNTVILMLCNTIGHACRELTVKLSALCPEAMYKERFTQKEYRGELLENVGLKCSVAKDFEAKILIFEKN